MRDLLSTDYRLRAGAAGRTTLGGDKRSVAKQNSYMYVCIASYRGDIGAEHGWQTVVVEGSSRNRRSVAGGCAWVARHCTRLGTDARRGAFSHTHTVCVWVWEHFSHAFARPSRICPTTTTTINNNFVVVVCCCCCLICPTRGNARPWKISQSRKF